jgi:hypothetical protein
MALRRSGGGEIRRGAHCWKGEYKRRLGRIVSNHPFVQVGPALRLYSAAGPPNARIAPRRRGAGAYCAFARLVERGKAELAHPTPPARYAVRPARGGRRVGAKLTIRDASSDPCRLDFAEWLRRLARALSGGESTKEAARGFRISRPRVSQVRRERKESWEAFQGGRPSKAAGA